MIHTHLRNSLGVALRAVGAKLRAATNELPGFVEKKIVILDGNHGKRVSFTNINHGA